MVNLVKANFRMREACDVLLSGPLSEVMDSPEVVHEAREVTDDVE